MDIKVWENLIGDFIFIITFLIIRNPSDLFISFKYTYENIISKL